MQKSEAKKKAGLSAVEVLMLILLIGVMSAVAQPYVASIREEARRAQCRDNLRQIGFAVLQHENEHGALPGPIFRRVRRPEGSEDLRELNWIMDDYFGPRAEVWDCPTNTLLLDENVNPGGVVFLLNNRATATDPPRFFGYPGATPERGGEPKSLQEIQAAGQSPVARQLRALSEIWMITDADGLNYSAAYIGSSIGPDSVPIADGVPPVHDGGRNYIFFDGHVAYRIQGEFPP